MFSRILKILFVSLLIFSCGNIDFKKVDTARKMSADLLDSISSGNALIAFSAKYFNIPETENMLNQLRNKCDFANREGYFINDFVGRENGIAMGNFIYEYYLKCDSLRLILLYNLDDEIELYRFRIEPIEKDNFMITKPERRLKF